ncbi:hypothetical protein LguiA_021870 [Lonicera macranthoides]
MERSLDTMVDTRDLIWSWFKRETFKGDILEEITNLSCLVTLNVSNNHLTRKIPQKIGDMQCLETLYLSSKHFSGQIALGMSFLTFLNHLNLSQNNLSGLIPSGNQFPMFNETIYEGNPGLCGSPLLTKCEAATDEEDGDHRRHNGDDREDKYEKLGLFEVFHDKKYYGLFENSSSRPRTTDLEGSEALFHVSSKCGVAQGLDSPNTESRNPTSSSNSHGGWPMLTMINSEGERDLEGLEPKSWMEDERYISHAQRTQISRGARKLPRTLRGVTFGLLSSIKSLARKTKSSTLNLLAAGFEHWTKHE